MTSIILWSISVIRILIGVVIFIAPNWSLRRMGMAEDKESTQTFHFLNLFGVREISLGVLSLYAYQESSFHLAILLINAGTDFLDMLSSLLLKRRGLEPKGNSMLIAGLATFAWIVGIWLL